MGAFFTSILNTCTSWSITAEQMLSAMITSAYRHGSSTRDTEHARRAKRTSAADKTISLVIIFQGSQQAILSNKSNKAQCIDMLMVFVKVVPLQE